MVRMEPPWVPAQVMPDYDTDDVARLLESIPAKQSAYTSGAKRLHVMNLRDRALIALLFDTGSRAMEVCDVSMQDVDRDVRRIIIRAGKGGKGRIIAYSPETAGMHIPHLLLSCRRCVTGGSCGPFRPSGSPCLGGLRLPDQWRARRKRGATSR